MLGSRSRSREKVNCRWKGGDCDDVGREDERMSKVGWEFVRGETRGSGKRRGGAVLDGIGETRDERERER